MNTGRVSAQSEEAVREATMRAVETMRAFSRYVATLDPEQRAALAWVVQSQALPTSVGCGTAGGCRFSRRFHADLEEARSHDRGPGL